MVWCASGRGVCCVYENVGEGLDANTKVDLK